MNLEATPGRTTLPVGVGDGVLWGGVAVGRHLYSVSFGWGKKKRGGWRVGLSRLGLWTRSVWVFCLPRVCCAGALLSPAGVVRAVRSPAQGPAHAPGAAALFPAGSRPRVEVKRFAFVVCAGLLK